MKKIICCVFVLLLFAGCSSGDEESSVIPDSYKKIETVFEGYPSKEEVQPMLESLMSSHGMEVTDDNVLKVANMLFVMKKQSLVGVTEMEILKHMYQNDQPSLTLPELCGISSGILEKTK